MKNFKRLKPAKKTRGMPSGFAKYVNIEKELIKYLSDDLFTINKQNNFNGSNTKVFAENVGDCKLFSIIEVENFYTNAKTIYGKESASYVQQKIENACQFGNRRQLSKAPKLDKLTLLREQFPNFSQAIDMIEGAFALSHISPNGYLQISPLLLLGPPGVGKTAFVQSLGKLIGINFTRIDIGTSSSSAILGGLSLTWGSGRCGEIFNLLTDSEMMNPIVMLDEIDKAVGNHVAPIEPILLSLLETESAASFKDEAISIKLDASKIIWIATANYKEQISEALLSRFTFVEIKQPNREQTKKIILNIYKNTKTINAWGESFAAELEDDVINKLSENTPRVASKLLQQAFGMAAINKRHKILVDDIPNKKTTKSKSIGFL